VNEELEIDDHLIALAQDLPGLRDINQRVSEALNALLQRERTRRLTCIETGEARPSSDAGE
jgi:hypothetical protein